MRFRFVEEQRGVFPIDRLCQGMNVSPRGLRAFRSRPASRRQRTDMVILAHIREQSRLSLNAIFLGQFGQRQLLPDRFRRNTGFEIRRMVLACLHLGSILSQCDPP